MHKYMHIHTSTYIHTYIRTYIHTYYLFAYLSTYRHAYIHIYMHINMHTHVHTQTNTQRNNRAYIQADSDIHVRTHSPKAFLLAASRLSLRLICADTQMRVVCASIQADTSPGTEIFSGLGISGPTRARVLNFHISAWSLCDAVPGPN